MSYRSTRADQCAKCGFSGSASQLDVHHKDGNHANDDPANLITLCANCHRLEHGGAVMSAALYGALRSAAEAVTRSTTERDGLIREAHAQGCSLRNIGDAVRLSHAGVAKIIRKAAP